MSSEPTTLKDWEDRLSNSNELRVDFDLFKAFFKENEGFMAMAEHAAFNQLGYRYKCELENYSYETKIAKFAKKIMEEK